MAAQTEPAGSQKADDGGGGSPRKGDGDGGGGGGSQAGQRDEEAGSPGREEEEEEEEAEECRICYSAFDADSRAPKVLECLHTFCLHCLSQMARHQAPCSPPPGLALSSLACPLCRHRTPLPEGSARNLPLNTRLLPASISASASASALRLEGLLLLLPPPLPPLAPLAPGSGSGSGSAPFLQRPLAEPSGPRPPRAQRRRQEVRTVRCVCVVFTFFSLMVVSITGPLFLNYSGWVELFMVSLFLVVAIVLALFSIMPYLLHSHQHRTLTAAFLAGERAQGPSRGPPMDPMAGPSRHS